MIYKSKNKQGRKKHKMDEVSKLKKQVAIYGLAVIAVCEIVSLFIIGFDIGFTVFLLAGFAAALVNFWLLAFFLQKMLDSGNAGFSTISFVIRILIYCAVFFISVKQGHTPELGRLPDRDTRTKSSSLLLQCCQAGLQYEAKGSPGSAGNVRAGGRGEG